MKKRMITMLIVVIGLLSIFTAAFAVDMNAGGFIDVLHDHDPNLKWETAPASKWDWSNGTYTGTFDIVQATYTNYYFTGNSSGQIKYTISGQSDANKTCRVDSYCKTCSGSVITSYSFLPSDTPSNRVVTLGSHANHNIYFRIVAFDGGEFWSNNDFAGTIKVSI